MVSVSLEIKVPKTWWDEREVLRELEKTLKQDVGKSIQRDFKETVRGWHNQPNFPIVFRKNANEMAVRVSPSGSNKDQYIYVHEGTAPRIIAPKPSRGANANLTFAPGYVAGTKRGSISSKRYKRSGKTITVPYVRHPGIEAREFSDTISKKQQWPFAAAINEAIWRAMTN